VMVRVYYESQGKRQYSVRKLTNLDTPTSGPD